MIDIKQFNKTYHLKTGNVLALRDVDLHINKGEIFGVIGYSGAGKSTLVRCINLLETPESGAMTIDGGETISFVGGKPFQQGKLMGERKQGQLRKQIGMIFQHFNLLDRSTVFENVAYTLQYTGMSKQQIEKRVMELLALVDLTDKTDVYPSQLSGGQKQRVAIARALANNPSILLSDEATSALDPDATESILHLLKELNEKLGLTIVLITHEMAVIKQVCHRVAVMEHGAVVESGPVYDIFSDPQQPITKKFISSASTLTKADKMIEDNAPMLQLQEGQILVKLTFGQSTVNDSVISKISRRFHINLNIVLANMDILQGQMLGGMIAIMEGDDVESAINYLREHSIHVEVMKIWNP